MIFTDTPAAATMALILALAVAGCSDEAPTPVVDGDESAKGEILGGTISDDMLPLESVTSRSPQLEDEPEATSAPQSEPVSGEPVSSAPGEAAADPAPVSIPAPASPAVIETDAQP